MTVDEIKSQIERAFANTPHPGNNFGDISATQWDEGIVDYFRRSTWRGHTTVNLRKHVAALNFFTDKAFRYWLPAFMLAELDEPEKADVISESIASQFQNPRVGAERLRIFSKEELTAISTFLGECARRYRSPYRRRYLQAQAAIESQRAATN